MQYTNPQKAKAFSKILFAAFATLIFLGSAPGSAEDGNSLAFTEDTAPSPEFSLVEALPTTEAVQVDAKLMARITDRVTTRITSQIHEQVRKTKINFKKLAATEKAKALKLYIKLLHEKNSQKNKKRQARKRWQNARRNLRHLHHHCWQSIKKRSPGFTSGACKQFMRVYHKMTRKKSAVVLATTATSAQASASWGRRRRTQKVERRQKKRAHRQERRQKRRQRRQQRRHRRQMARQNRKRSMQMWKQMRGHLKANWKKACSAFKAFKKRLHGAKYKYQKLPKMMLKMKPHIEKAMSKSNTKNGAGKKGGDVVKKTPSDKITAKSVLESYIKWELEAAISPVMDDVFKDVTKAIWDFVDPLWDALKEAVITAVGEIPFVGGILSAIVSEIFTIVHDVLEKALDFAMDKLKEFLQEKIIDAIAEACMDVAGVFIKSWKKDKEDSCKEGSLLQHVKSDVHARHSAAAAAQKIADHASAALQHSLHKHYKKAAAKSAKKAKGAKKSMISGAHAIKRSIQKTAAYDKMCEAAERAKDRKSVHVHKVKGKRKGKKAP
jgi:hypothetical protein